MAELNAQLQPVIQAMGELFQAGRVDLAGREERKTRGKVVEQLVAASRHTDGCSHTSTRAWIQDMDLAAERVGQNGIVDVVTQTVQGALRHALEAFIRGAPGQRADVPWRDIRGNVLRHFLSTDEEAALRDMVEGQLVQEVGEAENVYARRYKEAAQRAYPVANRNQDQHRILVKYFLNGLRRSTLARDVIRIHDPHTLDQAVDHVAVLCAREEAYQRLSRHQTHHEAMEVDAVQVTTSRLEKLEVAVVAVAEAVTKMASQRRDDGAPRRDNKGSGRRRDTRNWDDQGRPRCFRCEAWGHMARDCTEQQDRRHSGPAMRESSGN